MPKLPIFSSVSAVTCFLQRACGEVLRPPEEWGKWDCENWVFRPIFLPPPPFPPIFPILPDFQIVVWQKTGRHGGSNTAMAPKKPRNSVYRPTENLKSLRPTIAQFWAVHTAVQFVPTCPRAYCHAPCGTAQVLCPPSVQRSRPQPVWSSLRGPPALLGDTQDLDQQKQDKSLATGRTTRAPSPNLIEHPPKLCVWVSHGL